MIIDIHWGVCEIVMVHTKLSPSPVIREDPHLADYGYGYVLVIRKVYAYSWSSAWPDCSDYGYVFDSQKHAAAQSVFSYGHLRINWPQNVVLSLTLRMGSRHSFSVYSESCFVRNLPSAEPPYSVDRAGWQTKMASIECWIPWRNAHRPLRLAPASSWVFHEKSRQI